MTIHSLTPENVDMWLEQGKIFLSFRATLNTKLIFSQLLLKHVYCFK